MADVNELVRRALEKPMWTFDVAALWAKLIERALRGRVEHG